MTDDDSATKAEPDEEATNKAEPDDDAASKAQSEEEEVEEAKKVMEDIEEGDPPEKLEDWPGGKAKYQTYGGPDAESGYEDGATAKLGPSNLRHHEDGSVTIDGEEVDSPDEYKGEPIPGGPSDPDAPPDPAMIGQETDDEQDSESGSGSENGDSGDDGRRDAS